MNKSIEIDVAKLESFCTEHGGKVAVARSMMRSDSFFHTVLRTGKIGANAYSILHSLYPDADILPSAEPEKIESNHNTEGWGTKLSVWPGMLLLELTFNGEVVKMARAKIRTDVDGQLAIPKAVSYAAHMIYKFLEQDLMEEGGDLDV